MITKQRLEELINNNGTIYEVKYHNINPVKLNSEVKIFKNCIYVPFELEGKYLRHKYYNNLFETEEYAKFELEFGNITRTETLKLPKWEEFFNSGKSIVFRDAYGDIQELKQYSREIYINEQYCGYLTKENYIEACRICKKLFLGEEI